MCNFFLCGLIYSFVSEKTQYVFEAILFFSVFGDGIQPTFPGSC